MDLHPTFSLPSSGRKNCFEICLKLWLLSVTPLSKSLSDSGYPNQEFLSPPKEVCGQPAPDTVTWKTGGHQQPRALSCGHAGSSRKWCSGPAAASPNHRAWSIDWGLFHSALSPGVTTSLGSQRAQGAQLLDGASSLLPLI